MDHSGNHEPIFPNRVGFHYFPDILHFNDAEIQRWLPILKRLQAQWLVILTPIERAIPESFIQAFSSEEINLIIDFDLAAGMPFIRSDLEPLIEVYGKWGAKYILLNHTPNLKKSWTPRDWGNSELIANFSNQFIEFARISLDSGIRPVFSPLYPGGDYWDMAFLKNCGFYILDHASDMVINNLTFSAYGWDFGKSLDWGIGGQAAWPQAKAYHTSNGTQDQMGFRSHEWYSAVVESIFSKKFPFLLFQIGLPGEKTHLVPDVHKLDINKLDAMIRLLNRENVFNMEVPGELLNHIPDEVISGNFYLLASDNPQDLDFQWFSPLGEALLPAQAFFIRHQPKVETDLYSTGKINKDPEKNRNFKFNRYILISEQLCEQIPDLLEKLHPYLIRHKPLVGSNQTEAIQSAVIVYISTDFESNNDLLDDLRVNGSLVMTFHPDEIPNMISELSHAEE